MILNPRVVSIHKPESTIRCFLGDNFQIPNRQELGTAGYVLSQFPHPDHAETKVALIDLDTNSQVTYAQLSRPIHVLASGLYNGLEVRKGDVVFLLSPNSILFPVTIGAILSPAAPPVILGLVKHATKVKCDLSSLKRVGSGEAPLSKELSDRFKERLPWVELRQGYGLTESCAAATFFIHDEQSKTHPASCGMLVPTFTKIVDDETGSPLPPIASRIKPH